MELVFDYCDHDTNVPTPTAPRWCTVPVPDELQALDGGARIPCLRWQSEHPMTE